MGNSGGMSMKMGGCPAAYTTECSYKMTDKDGDSIEMPMTTDTTDCGKTTMAVHTKDCAACTGKELEEGEKWKAVQRAATPVHSHLDSQLWSHLFSSKSPVGLK